MILVNLLGSFALSSSLVFNHSNCSLLIRDVANTEPLMHHLGDTEMTGGRNIMWLPHRMNIQRQSNYSIQNQRRSPTDAQQNGTNNFDTAELHLSGRWLSGSPIIRISLAFRGNIFVL